MTPYRNFGGNSGVRAYEIGPEFIRVQFADGSIYLYTYEKPGSQNVEHMKQLAVNGRGLNSFINTTVRSNYARREF